MADYTSSSDQPFGGVLVTFSTSPELTARATNWGGLNPGRIISRNDKHGNRADFRVEPDPKDGSVTVQVPAASSTMPPKGTKFEVEDDNTEYVITAITENKPEGEFWTWDITYTQAEGPGKTVSEESTPPES